jgi:hypothetical protein
LYAYKKIDPVKIQFSTAKKKVHQSYKIGKASQIPKNEAYFSCAAVMRDAAQHRNWTFYEAIKKGLRQNWLKPLILRLEAASGFEPENSGFAGRCLTTWLCRQKNGAGNEIRTRDFNLGKVALYH